MIIKQSNLVIKVVKNCSSSDDTRTRVWLDRLKRITMIPLIILTSCEAPNKSIDTSGLVITPEAILITNPALGQGVAEARVTIQNSSNFDTEVTVNLIEEDDLEELSVLDADQWTQGLTIASRGGRTLTLRWESQDAQIDRAQLIIRSSSEEKVIQVETEAPQAGVELSVSPTLAQVEGLLRAQMKASQDGFASIVVTYRSAGISPLIIDEICLSREGAGCYEALDQFKICDGEEATPSNCLPLSVSRPLTLDEERKLTLIYEPSSAMRTSTALFVLKSNAFYRPEAKIQLIGRPCLSTGGELECSPFHYMDQSQLSLGAQTMRSVSGKTLRGSVDISTHLSHDTKQQFHLKGRLTP